MDSWYLSPEKWIRCKWIPLFSHIYKCRTDVWIRCHHFAGLQTPRLFPIPASRPTSYLKGFDSISLFFSYSFFLSKTRRGRRSLRFLAEADAHLCSVWISMEDPVFRSHQNGVTWGELKDYDGFMIFMRRRSQCVMKWLTTTEYQNSFPQHSHSVKHMVALIWSGSCVLCGSLQYGQINSFSIRSPPKNSTGF